MTTRDSSRSIGEVARAEQAPFPEGVVMEKFTLRMRDDSGEIVQSEKIESQLPAEWNLNSEDRQLLVSILYLREVGNDKVSEIIDFASEIKGTGLSGMSIDKGDLVLPVLRVRIDTDNATRVPLLERALGMELDELKDALAAIPELSELEDFDRQTLAVAAQMHATEKRDGHPAPIE